MVVLTVSNLDLDQIAPDQVFDPKFLKRINVSCNVIISFKI